ncbi:hypothetical protein ACIB24_09045 [Spongisporangium articulatum]|uniref:DUF5666 domain-containing protein n=1 Tax=Spongisporangium articulatum TaxID=3362603 RepID=A0ABW8ALF5_9ACTN
MDTQTYEAPPTNPTEPAPAQTSAPTPKGGVRARIAAGVLALALVGGGTWAVVHFAGDGSTSVAGSQTASGPGGNGQMPGGAAPASGTITAIDSSSITVKSSSGTSTTYTLADDVAVENDGTTASVSDLAVGDTVVVLTGAGPNAGSSSGSTTTDSTTTDSTTTDSTTATRILAGTSATAGPGQGGQAPTGQAPSAATTQNGQSSSTT